MITFELCTSIDEQIFDRLYEDSRPILENGNFPWHLWPNVVTDEARKAHIRKSFQNVLDKGLCWLVRTDGYPVLLCVGTIQGDLIKWALGLSGLDLSGSRAWLYDPTYASSRDAFWDAIGVRGWIMSEAAKNRDIINHVAYKNEQGEVRANVQFVESATPGFIDIIVTKAVAE